MAGTAAGAPPPEVQAAKEAAQEAAKQPDAQQGLAHDGRTSITSVSDPVFDYLSQARAHSRDALRCRLASAVADLKLESCGPLLQPYERPKKKRAQARQPPPHTSLSSASDPAYDYMQQARCSPQA